MKFVICNLSETKAHGIEIIPTMRQSVDSTQVVLHEAYIRNIDEFSKLKRYEFNDAEFTQLMNSEAWTHSEDYVQPNEDYAKVKAMQILTADTKANINTMSLSNKEALDVKEFYPVWSANSVQVKKGEKYQCDDLLWEVIQDHTTQELWKPSLETSSLWKVVNEEHEGTEADPIPYVQMMAFEKGKYYEQYGVIYLCTLTTVTGYPNDLKDLPAIVTKVE